MSEQNHAPAPTGSGNGSLAPKRHRLRSGLYVLPQGDDEVFVRDGSRAAFSKIVKDPAERRILTRVVQEATDPLSVEELAIRLGAEVAAIGEIVEQLVDSEVLVPERASQAPMRVELVGTGQVADTCAALASGDEQLSLRRHDDLAQLEQTLNSDENAGASDVEEASAVVVAVATDTLRPGLNIDVNEFSLSRGIPTVYTYVDGREAVVGPFVQPGETPCYLCHDIQDEGARHLRDEYLVYKDSLARGVPGPDAVPAVAGLAAAWLRLALVEHDPEVSGFLDGRLLRVETSRMEVMTHRILTIPRCPACSAIRPELEHTFA